MCRLRQVCSQLGHLISLQCLHIISQALITLLVVCETLHLQTDNLHLIIWLEQLLDPFGFVAVASFDLHHHLTLLLDPLLFLLLFRLFLFLLF